MKKLSIITTVYKKGQLAVDQINRLVAFVADNNLNAEIIAVVDGQIRNDQELIQQFITRNSLQNLVKSYTYILNRGKGFAQRYGYSKSTGDVIMFIDADLDIRMESVEIAYKTFIENEDSIDAIYPSKYDKDSDLDGTNIFRKIISRVHKSITFLFLGKNSVIDDVSCGLKIFKRSSFELFQRHLFVDRFATDSEVYFWINRLELKVIKVPFYMNMPQNSTSVSVIQITKVLFDIVVIAFKLRFNAIVLESKKPFATVTSL